MTRKRWCGVLVLVAVVGLAGAGSVFASDADPPDSHNVREAPWVGPVPPFDEGIVRKFVGVNPDGSAQTVEVDRAVFREKMRVLADRLDGDGPPAVYAFQADADGNPVAVYRCVQRPPTGGGADTSSNCEPIAR
jgi:hypothetical protein